MTVFYLSGVENRKRTDSAYDACDRAEAQYHLANPTEESFASSSAVCECSVGCFSSPVREELQFDVGSTVFLPANNNLV